MEEREIRDHVTRSDQDEPSTPIIANGIDAGIAPVKDTEAALRPTLETPHFGALVQQWIDRALNFFSHASNETLGACFVGLGASTYLVLGRVGLVLIGVVGGIALHATWEGDSLNAGPGADRAETEAKKRRELGLEVVQRVWRWREQQQKLQADTHGSEGLSEELEDIKLKLYKGKDLDFADLRPETAAALDTFTTAVIRDYVKWWYSPVLPGEDVFPSACRQTLTAFLLSLSSHMSRKRPTEMFVNFVINSSSIIIAFFAELSAALNASPNSDAASAIDTYIQMKPDSSLARMLDADAQDKKLGMVGEDILQNFLDSKAYNFPPVHTFLHQILSKLILGMTLDSCSKAEWINGWIVYLLEEGEPEIMQAIDAGMENATDGRSARSATAVITETDDPLNTPDHKRHRSRAEEAMEEALQEAQRLTAMIAEEEAKKAQSQSATTVSSSDVSESTTEGIHTPTSSQSDSAGLAAPDASRPEAPSHVAVSQQSHKVDSDVISPSQPATSFDQILPQIPQPRAAEESKPVLTLYKAKIAIFDDSVPGEKAVYKSKPTVEYLIQVEPSDSRFSGWMIARKFIDFEVLHEVLRRISVITGARFNEAHATLPAWKSVTKPNFRLDLESYLTDALRYQQLAECEGMKRFLEKDQGLLKSPSSGKGLGWPDPLQVGKGMMDVLTKAPKEVSSGGKALFGGVTSVLGGGKKSATASPIVGSVASPSNLSLANGSPHLERSSSDLIRRPFSASRSNTSQESLHRQSSLSQQPIQSSESRPSLSSRTSFTSMHSVENHALEAASSSSPARTESTPQILETLNLPPPPSAIDEFEIVGGITPAAAPPRVSVDTAANELSKSLSTAVVEATPSKASEATPKSASPSKTATPMTEQETIVTVDLLFAVISELYTLSSAWTIRRTLLQAARTFLLRPGNPQLEAIRVLIQESVIDANSSDAGIAKMILRTRENSLPTEEELKKWPKPLDEQEKEQLRLKARKLLVESGMPQALTSVMGAAASGEALGKVFDCLQVEKVARSMLFGLMLQALRAAVQ